MVEGGVEKRFAFVPRKLQKNPTGRDTPTWKPGFPGSGREQELEVLSSTGRSQLTAFPGSGSIRLAREPSETSLEACLPVMVPGKVACGEMLAEDHWAQPGLWKRAPPLSPLCMSAPPAENS